MYQSLHHVVADARLELTGDQPSILGQDGVELGHPRDLFEGFVTDSFAGLSER